MKIVSFYTKNTIYEKEVEDLIASCQALALDFYIEPREDLGTWEKNCGQKPLFIYECLKRFNTPLLWVDADGIILKKPDLDLGPCDLGLYFNHFRTKHARNATIYASPTKATLDFMLVWHKKLQEMQTIPDQPVMIDLIRKIPLKIGKLPLEYMQIFDRDCLSLEKTVILHFQASRTCRMAPLFWKHLSGKELKTMRLQASPRQMKPQ